MWLYFSTLIYAGVYLYQMKSNAITSPSTSFSNKIMINYKIPSKANLVHMLVYGVFSEHCLGLGPCIDRGDASISVRGKQWFSSSVYLLPDNLTYYNVG